MRYLVVILLIWTAIPAIQAQEVYNPVTSECWFTIIEDTQSYTDRGLTEEQVPVGVVQTGQSFQVLEINTDVTLLALGHAMSFWADLTKGVISGNCETANRNQINVVIVSSNTRLWSQPDVTNGSIITTIPENTTITVIGGSAVGRIQYTSTIEGIWYPVQYGSQRGWVWTERLNFTDIATLPIISAYTQQHARLWSQPNVHIATLLQEIEVNRPVEIIGGPIVGYIQYDNTESGVWYQVRINNVTGWIWGGRLLFD